MHGAALAFAIARGSTVKFGEEPPEIAPLGDDVAVPAMSRGDHIVLAQRRADADSGRLFPDIGMNETRHLGLFE